MASSRRFLSAKEESRVKYVFEYLTSAMSSELTDGDLKFLISVEEQWKKDGKLSDAQLEIVEKIYAKY